tara:strand:+ start:263 stop:472 length:210 start_codon:yes stop_codon:yes gene_type:complete
MVILRSKKQSKTKMYQVFFISDKRNLATGNPELVAAGKPNKTRKGANKKRDHLDSKYGAYRHTVMELTV